MQEGTVNRIKELLMGDPEADTEASRNGFLKTRGLSVEQFAREVGVTRTSVYGYMKDLRRPTVETMVKMCEVIGIPLSEGVTYCTPRTTGRQPRS